jgi:hypothetical protein
MQARTKIYHQAEVNRRPHREKWRPSFCGLGPESVDEAQDGDGKEEVRPQIEYLT